MEKETVTISLETYESMKAELSLLRRQVQEKTIVKNVLPKPFGWALVILAYCMFILVMTNL